MAICFLHVNQIDELCTTKLYHVISLTDVRWKVMA